MGIITSETNQSNTKNIVTKELETDSKVVEPSEHPITDALLGKDPPIEDAHPGLQPALVFLSYPFALILIISVVGLYFLFTQKDGQQGKATAPATQSPTAPATQSPTAPATQSPPEESTKIQVP